MITAAIVMAASDGPSWLWYATRGLGTTLLIVLTSTVVLGILTATRWSGPDTPGFVAVDLHRNLSLLGILLLLAHMITTVLDPFAHITVRDVLVPFGAAYRPLWLGLGVVAFWTLIAVAGTSLLRARIGARAWRLIHWTAYASWPLALVHGLGTGSDSRAYWMVAVVSACVSAVVLAILERIRDGRAVTLPARGLAGVGVVAFVVVGCVWAVGGPLQPGWSVKAGTPSAMTSAASTTHVHQGPQGFSDPLVGLVVRDKSGAVQIAFRDTVDTALTIVIRSPNGNETLPVVMIARDGRVLCAVPASVDTSLYAVCGKTRLTITLYGSVDVYDKGGNITGRLDTSGPLL